MPSLSVSSESSSPEPQNFEDRRKRFRTERAPLLRVDASGNVVDLTAAARHLLEYDADELLDTAFFSHVHGKNLYRVMRDVADMVCYGKEQCSWLLCLKTGRSRWRWYKAKATNRLNGAAPHIIIHLNDLNNW